MATVRKFEFDLSFDAPHAKPAPPPLEPEPVAEPEPEPFFEPEEPPPPPEPVFSLSDLESAQKTAWEDGFAAGEQAALTRMEHRRVEATAALILHLQNVGDTQKQAISHIESQATFLAQHVIARLFPALTTRVGTDEIAHLIKDIFAEAIQEPRLVVRVAPDLLEIIQAIVIETARHSGYDGKHLVLADPTLAPGDCRIDWSDGGVERAPKEILATLDTAIARSLAHFDQTVGAKTGPVPDHAAP